MFFVFAKVWESDFMANTIESKSSYAVSLGCGVSVSSENDEINALNEKLEETNYEIEMLKSYAKQTGGSKGAASQIAGSFDPKLELSKVASATTTAQVRRYINGINSKINILKKSGEYDVLIRQFKKIIEKAEEKVTRLQAEEKAEKKAKALERLKKLEESKKIRTNNQMSINNRKLKETSDIENAEAITFVGDYGTGVSESSAVNIGTVTAASSAVAAVGAEGSVDVSV